MGRLPLAAAAVALAFLFAGCGAGPGPGSDDTTARVEPEDPVEGVYRADTVAAEPFAAATWDGELQLTLLEGEIRFRGDCNNFFGEASWAGGRFRAAAIGGTQMGCPPDAMARDAWLVDFFSTADRLEWSGSGVSIHRGEDAIRFDRIGDVPEPVASPDEPTSNDAG